MTTEPSRLEVECQEVAERPDNRLETTAYRAGSVPVRLNPDLEETITKYDQAKKEFHDEILTFHLTFKD